MGVFIDLLLAAIVIVILIVGYHRGFIRSVMNIVSLAAAIFCGYHFTPALSDYYNSAFFGRLIGDRVYEALGNLLNAGSQSIDLSKLFEDCPEAFQKILNLYGTDFGKLSEYYQEQVSSSAGDITRSVSDFIAGPAAGLVSNVLAFLTIFLGVLLLLTLLTTLLDLLFRLPVLKTVNRMLGLVLGAVCGLVFLWVMSHLLQQLIPALAVLFPDYIGEGDANNSFIIKLVTQYLSL